MLFYVSVHFIFAYMVIMFAFLGKLQLTIYVFNIQCVRALFKYC